MDTLDDNEIESIWERTKKHIDASKLRLKPQETVSEAIERVLRDSTEFKQTKTLIEKGFADRAAKVGNIISNFKQKIEEIKQPIKKTIIQPRILNKFYRNGKLLPRFKIGNKRISIYRANGEFITTRNPENIHITEKPRNSRLAFYVVDNKTGHVFTWGYY